MVEQRSKSVADYIHRATHEWAHEAGLDIWVLVAYLPDVRSYKFRFAHRDSRVANIHHAQWHDVYWMDTDTLSADEFLQQLCTTIKVTQP